MSIPVFKPSIRRRDMHSVLSCLVTDVIGPASLAQELVHTVAGDFSHAGGFAFREHTRGIWAVMQALDLEAKDQVVLSPLAPGAYRHALAETGVQPVFADVHEADACMDAQSVRDALEREGEGVKALFVHAPLGRVPHLEALGECSLPVVLDLGEAVGSLWGEDLAGSSCDFLIIPLEMDGIVTAGGGTLVLARDKKGLAALAQAVSSLTPDAFLPDLNASLGLVQWKEFPSDLADRRQISEAYTQALMKGKHRTLVDGEEPATSVPYSWPVVLSSPVAEVRRYARKKGVETQTAFSDRVIEGYPDGEEFCPRGLSLMMNTVLFPLYPTLGKSNVQLVSRVLSTLP